MSTLIEAERALYDTMWAVEDYAKMSPGEQLVSIFLDMAKIEHPFRYSVLDAGCGSGKGAIKLRNAGFQVTMCDLTDAGLIDEARGIPFREAALWQPLRHAAHKPFRFGQGFDYAYCCDVLEHIPTPFTMLVVSRLLDVARKGVFLSIAMQGDNFGVWAGVPLHKTVQNFVTWRDQLDTVGRVKECRDMLLTGCYYVESR